jgi:arylsulfatase A-like enzyme
MSVSGGRRPNFLFFIADQHRFDHLGCYGNGIVRTPHIDALAAAGWVSDAFHVASPICMPNRATLMTGRMPSVHGVRHNGIPLSLTSTTFVDRLREAGYRTGLIGKSHLQNMTGNPPTWPPDPKDRLALEARAPDGGRYDQEWGPLWASDPTHDLDLPFYGFGTVDLTINHGDDLQGHYRRWLRAEHPGAEVLLGPEHASPTPEFELTRVRQAWRTKIPPAQHPNAYCADRTIARIEESAAAGDPFFLMCSFADPHHPYTPPGKYWEMYRPEAVELPRAFRTNSANPPPHVKWLHDERDAGRAVKHTPQLFACTEREAREAIALNYGLITFIDDCIGRVIARLEALGLADDTIIVFTSDHGDYMGDHQLLLKGPIHYRGIVRTPFIWRDPAGPRQRSAALAGTIDIAPTILARAGIAGFNGIQGRNLLPLMQGETDTVYDSMLIEEEGQRFGLGLPSRARLRSLVTENHRLSLYDGVAWGELYDRKADPDEMVNLWDEPGSATLRAALTLRLAHKMIEVSETSPNPTASA